MIEKDLKTLSAVCAHMTQDRDRDGAISAAVALMICAKTIFTTIGGNELAAMQFYSFADSLAAKGEMTP